jgi:hypothetical protein
MAQITRDEAKALGLQDEDDMVEVDDAVLQKAKDQAFYMELDRVPDGDKQALRDVLARHGRLHEKIPGTPDVNPSKPALDTSEEAEEAIRKAREEGDTRDIEVALWKAGRLDEMPQSVAQAEHDAMWGVTR